MLLLIAPASAVRVSSSTDGTAMAGSAYTIICTVTKPAGLLAIPDITWTNPSGTELNGQMNNQIINTTTVTTVRVQFVPLQTSHGGLYTCQVSLLSPSLLTPVNLTSSTTVLVQSKLKTRINFKCITHYLLFYSSITNSRSDYST